MTGTTRTARLVLVTRDGTVVGALPPFSVATPWWQDIAPVVHTARQRYHIDVVVLRMLANELAMPPGGSVTYLAEVTMRESAMPSLEPWNGVLDEHPLRQSYARPGGPAADIAWATSVLEKQGLDPNAPAEQIRTWNLSSVWRLPIDEGYAWLKVVPPFMAREGQLLTRLAGASVPTVLGHDLGRCLLAEISGSDLYDATRSQLLDMVTLLVELQASWAGRAEGLLSFGLLDWRAAALTRAIASTLERTTALLDERDVRVLSSFVADLPRRFDALAACGLSDTLVHGDFHPGNFRGDDRAITLLDWGDSCVGHPLLDQSAFIDRVPADAKAAIHDHWLRTWRAYVPGADPERAAQLLKPIAAARQAAVYLRFLDHIEPSEHGYHRDDPVSWLRAAAALLRAADASD